MKLLRNVIDLVETEFHPQCWYKDHLDLHDKLSWYLSDVEGTSKTKDTMYINRLLNKYKTAYIQSQDYAKEVYEIKSELLQFLNGICEE